MQEVKRVAAETVLQAKNEDGLIAAKNMETRLQTANDASKKATQQLAEKDKQLAEQSAQLAEKEAQITQLNEQISVLNEEIKVKETARTIHPKKN